MKNLTIVFLDFDDIKNPLLGGGQARATAEVGKRLVSLGHKVIVVASRYPGCKDRTENGIEYKHVGVGTKNIRLNNAFYILSMPFIVPFIKSDIIVECFTAPISTMFSPLFTKTPVVGLTSSFEADRFSSLYHLPFNKIEKFGLKFYKYAISLSEFFSKKITDVNSQAIVKTIPEGVGKEFFEIKKHKAKHILFLGRLDMGQKGIDLLLRAYALIANRALYPLVIAGNGPDEEKIKKLITELNLEKNVSMIGPAWGKKKEKYLSESLFVAFSSRNETFSCFALEAFAAGLPLVAFDIPGIAWTGEKYAKKVPVFDIEKYGEMLLVSMNEAKMSVLGKEAREFAKGFTWESVAKQFEDFFEEILKKEKNSER